MFKWCLILSFFTVSATVSAQQVTVPELLRMLDWEHFKIDTTLKKKGYLLMQKDVDSASSLYQYSHLERNEDVPTTVRSFMYMDVTAREMQSRLITYRTYDKDEFRDISTYLLSNNYKATEKFDFGQAKHTLYSNGTQTIRIKTITTKLKDGRTFIAYELELGR